LVLALYHAYNPACPGTHIQTVEAVIKAPPDKPIVAAFDFDGTLTRRDTLLPFLLFTLGASAVARHAITLSPTLAGYALGLIDNGVAKERVLVRCLSGMHMDELLQEGERFASYVLPGLLSHGAMQRFEWHKKQGHRCVVISASMELYVRPWATSAGFDDVIATRLEIQEDGRITGKLSGANCFGVEKVRRLESLLGERDGYTLYAYGDSRGDKELMSLANYAYYREMPNQIFT
jgi:HAD superfamily hydrolase (TIGR01490 family)